MFPQNTVSITNDVVSEEITETLYNTISKDLYYTPNYDFSTCKTIFKNGSPELIKDYRNIKNWFTKFVLTPIDTFKIYEGTGFGTSLLRLIGKKDVSCLELAQVKKEIEDGATLHPAISKITGISFFKNGSDLYIEIRALLQDGIEWADTIEVINFYG